MKKKTSGKNKIMTVMAVLLLLAGLAVIAYPYICQNLYQREADKVIREFERRKKIMADANLNMPDVAGIGVGDYENYWDWLYDLMTEYNKNLYEGKQNNLVDPFSYSQPDFSLAEFGFDEEMIGYLSIPRMDVRMPIYLGANKENMKRGAAHLTQTSLPIGGTNTNAVIAAHRGMSTAALFRDIEKLKTGDEVIITNFRETLYYQVAEIKIINPTDVEEILIQPNRDLVTLITCHPYRYNYQRYAVYCERVTEKKR